MKLSTVAGWLLVTAKSLLDQVIPGIDRSTSWRDKFNVYPTLSLGGQYHIESGSWHAGILLDWMY